MSLYLDKYPRRNVRACHGCHRWEDGPILGLWITDVWGLKWPHWWGRRPPIYPFLASCPPNNVECGAMWGWSPKWGCVRMLFRFLPEEPSASRSPMSAGACFLPPFSWWWSWVRSASICLESDPGSYCDSGVYCGSQRLWVGQYKGGVEAAYPNLLLASVRMSFAGSAPAGFSSSLELQCFTAHDVLLFARLVQKWLTCFFFDVVGKGIYSLLNILVPL